MAIQEVGNNYYIKSGIKIITTAQDIQRQLDIISERYVLLTNLKVNLTAKTLYPYFRQVVLNIVEKLNSTGQPLPPRPVLEWANSQKQLNGKISDTTERVSTTKIFTKQGWDKLYSTMSLKENLDTTLNLTLGANGELVRIRREVSTYATQIATKTELLSTKLLNLYKMNKINVKDFNTITTALAETNNLSGKASLNKLKEIENLLSDYSKRKEGLIGLFKSNIQKFVSWITITTGFFGVVKIISNTIKEVKKLDDAMVELNKVADLTVSQMESIQLDANNLANKVATTSDQVIRAIAQFKKAGYSLEDATSLAEIALRMVNVADGIESVEEASSSLIAIIKGFNFEANKASEILDLLNHTSNNFAVNVDNLTDGLSRISAVFAQTGTSLEETNAMLTATYEILRNAEVSATGLNAISQRMRRMTEDGENNYQVVAAIETNLQKYTRGAVSLYDKRTKELRSTYDVLADLAAIWDSLSSSAKATLTEIIAGNRQNKVLSALMSNWATVENVLDESAKATDSARQEEEKFLDSVTGKLNQLKQAIQEFATSSLTKDFEKGVLSFLTAIVQFGTKMGGIFRILTSLLAIRLAWKIPDLILTIRSMITATSTATVEIGGVTHAYKTYTIGNQEYIIATKAYGAMVDGANLAMKTLKSALTKAQLVLTGISIAIEGIKLFEYWRLNSLEKEAEAAENAYQTSLQNYENLTLLYKEYLNLLTKTTKTTTEIERLSVLEKTFAEKSTKSVENMFAKNMFVKGDTLEERIKKAQAVANLIREESIKQQQAVIKRSEKTASLYLPKSYWSRWSSSQGEARLHDFEDAPLKTKVDFLRDQVGMPEYMIGSRLEWQEALNVYQAMYDEYESLQVVIDLVNSTDVVELQVKTNTFLNSAEYSLDTTETTQATLYKDINILIDKIKKDISQGDLSVQAQNYLQTLISDYETQLDILLHKDFAFSFLEEKLSNLKQIQSDKEEELERQEKLKAIEEARLKVLEAERTYTLVRTEGGWKYILSEEELEQAQNELDQALRNAGLDDLSQAITGVEKLQNIYSLASGTVLGNMRTYFMNANNLSSWLAMSWEDKIKKLNSFGTLNGKTLSDLYAESEENKTVIPSDITKFFDNSHPSYHNGGIIGREHTYYSNAIDKLVKSSSSPLNMINGKESDVILNIGELNLPNVSNGSQLAEQLQNYAISQKHNQT